MGTVTAGGGWQQYCLRAAVDDWWRKWRVTREMMVAIDNSVHWHLTVEMDGSNSNGSGG
jgi:hypothetical protein